MPWGPHVRSCALNSKSSVWGQAPPIVRGTLDAAWTASKIAAFLLAILFTITNLAAGIYYVAAGHMRILELPGVFVGGVSILVLSLLFSFVVTVPVSAAIAICTYPFLRTLRGADRRVFGAVGFCVGALVWLWLWWNGPPGNCTSDLGFPYSELVASPVVRLALRLRGTFH
jgi:hypothetical protein